MGLEAVISEIQQKGRHEADRIRREGDLEVERVLRDAQQRSDEIKLSAEADVTRQVEHVLAQETSSANLVTKRATLNAEKELLDQIYRSTLEAIRRSRPRSTRGPSGGCSQPRRPRSVAGASG